MGAGVGVGWCEMISQPFLNRLEEAEKPRTHVVVPPVPVTRRDKGHLTCHLASVFCLISRSRQNIECISKAMQTP